MHFRSEIFAEFNCAIVLANVNQQPIVYQRMNRRVDNEIIMIRGIETENRSNRLEMRWYR